MSGRAALTEARDGLSSAMEVPAGAAQRLESLDQRVRVLEEEVAWLREASAKTDASGAMASAFTPPSGVPRVYRDHALEPSQAAPEASGRQEPAAPAVAEPQAQLTVELADLQAEVERLTRENRAQGAELALLRVLAAPQTERMQRLDDLQESDLRRWPREARENLREASDLVGRLRLRIAELEVN